jgi:UDP-glucuronate decarboxylase
MRDKIILEDIETINSSIDGDAFAGSSVLVTGGAGFLGSWLCEILVNSGAKVDCVDDFSTGRTQNIDHLTNDPTFTLHKGNVSTFQSTKKFDCIFHFAGHASPEEYLAHPIETLRTSSSGSANIAEIARKNDAVLEFASTSEIYGDAEIVPTPENYWGRVNPIGPRSCYDEGKRFAEALLSAYHKQYQLNVKIPRIFNSYGPRLREDGLYGRAMSRFVSQALAQEPITVYGDGTQTRSFCYVTDTITALLKIAVSDSANNEVINVGNGQEVTILELAKKIKTLSSSSSSIIFKSLPKDDPKRRCPDISKIGRLLNWKPEVKLETGIQRTLDWFSTKKVL